MWESHPLTSTLHPIVDPPIVGVRRVALVLVPKLSVLLHDQLVTDVLFKSNLLEGRTPLRAFSVDGSPSRGDAHLIANQSEDLISEISFHRKTAVASKREKLPLPAALKVKMTVSSRSIIHHIRHNDPPAEPGIESTNLTTQELLVNIWKTGWGNPVVEFNLDNSGLCTVHNIATQCFQLSWFNVGILTLSFVRVVMNSIM